MLQGESVPDARTEVYGSMGQTSLPRAREAYTEEGTLKSKEIFATWTGSGGDKRAHGGSPDGEALCGAAATLSSSPGQRAASASGPTGHLGEAGWSFYTPGSLSLP